MIRFCNKKKSLSTIWKIFCFLFFFFTLSKIKKLKLVSSSSPPQLCLRWPHKVLRALCSKNENHNILYPIELISNRKIYAFWQSWKFFYLFFWKNLHVFYDKFNRKNYERKIDWSVGNCQLWPNYPLYYWKIKFNLYIIIWLSG